jgi:hypothetical protein
LCAPSMPSSGCRRTRWSNRQDYCTCGLRSVETAHRSPQGDRLSAAWDRDSRWPSPGKPSCPGAGLGPTLGRVQASPRNPGKLGSNAKGCCARERPARRAASPRTGRIATARRAGSRSGHRGERRCGLHGEGVGRYAGVIEDRDVDLPSRSPRTRPGPPSSASSMPAPSRAAPRRRPTPGSPAGSPPSRCAPVTRRGTPPHPRICSTRRGGALERADQGGIH